MIPKPTEDTITNLLVETLKKYGVKAESFPSIRTPTGIRKPDIWCYNGGGYVIEAKFRERDLLNAVSKIYEDYIRYSKILGVQGAFAVLYPEELAKPMPPEVLEKLAYNNRFKVVAIFPPDDVRKSFAVYEGNLAEIAKTITEHVLTPPEHVEPNVDYIIKALQDSATYITIALKHLSGEDIENLFGGKEVFNNILQYEEKKYPVESMRLASAFLLVNQLLFYHVLSRMAPERFPEIDANNIKKPADLNTYFKKVTEVNYRAVFSYDVASRIPPKFTEQIKIIINVIKGLSPEKIGGDLLGTVFHDLIPLSVRKTVAAYYTNVVAAELLAWLSISRHDSKVADLAVGSGGLLVAAYRRKRYLIEQERKFTETDHKRIVEEELLGVDVMPFAASIAACHLALQSPEYFTDKVKIAIWDSTDLEPGKKIPSIADLRAVLKGNMSLERYAKRRFTETGESKGVISLTGEMPEEIPLERYDVIIMNPPFTRQERIPKGYKKVLSNRFSDYKQYLHGQMGYFGYFVLLADKFLKDGGKIALVLPATVLRVESCKGLRRLWAEKYHVEYIITTWHRSAFSESANFREILLVARKGTPDPRAKTAVVVIKTLPRTFKEAREFAETIKNVETDWDDEKLSVKILDYSTLTRNVNNWFKYIAVKDLSLIDITNKLLTSEKLTRFESKIVRGVETGRGGKVQLLTITRSERAIKREDVWIVEKQQGCILKVKNRFNQVEAEIPLTALRPALRRLSSVNRLDVSGMTDYVIVDEFTELNKLFSGSLTGFRTPKGFWKKWREYVEERMGHLVLIRRTDISARGTCLIAFYSQEALAPPGIAWLVKVRRDEAKILSLWLNSTFNLLQILLNRKETRGAFMQVDQYILRQLLVLDVGKLSESELKYLEEVFESVKNITLPSILQQLKAKNSVRVRIDQALLKVLGYKGDVDNLLDKLYKSLASEIETLAKMMKEIS